ncbi:MAG: M3 family oligoendopeptidase [Rhodobiaceae bacterium]|nr:M3 family oligoendopeptidase [Rhodobiaceae bacterium]
MIDRKIMMTQQDALPVWDLSALYEEPVEPKVAKDIATVAQGAKDFSAKYKGQVSSLAQAGSGEALAAAIGEFEALEEILGRLYSYAGLLYATDTTAPAHGKLYGDVQAQAALISADMLFFTLELNGIEDAPLETLMADCAALGRYRPWLRDLRLEKPYQLDDAQERLLLEKSVTGRSAWNRLFDDTMARLRFDVSGESLPLEATLDQLSDVDRGKRQIAAQALSKTFEIQLPVFSHIYNTLMKDMEIEKRWRGYDDVATPRHISNRVESEVVGALVDAVRASYPDISHRYYALKAKWLGLDKLEHWDRNAPLPQDSGERIAWSDAQAIVLDAYRGFSPEMAELAEPFFTQGWIDAAPRAGKAPGAFSHPTIPSAHPYVLLNYLGRTRDVMTLAHELGHGVHQRLAADQGLLMAETPLTLAETASVFGEMLTFRQLLANTKTVEQRRIMLASKVEDMINTAVRQTAFYQFERKVHEARVAGELTIEDINAAWMSVQVESLGPSVNLGAGYETYWAYIPHFIHSPFYVYAYSFGDCLVNSLYAVYQEEPDGFDQKYFAALRAGGTLRHKELLEPFGLDASDPTFWSRGLSVISGLIDELEALEGE